MAAAEPRTAPRPGARPRRPTSTSSSASTAAAAAPSTPASASSTTCSTPSPGTACSTWSCAAAATSRSTSTTPSRTSASASGRPSTGPSATAPESSGSPTATCRWTRPWPGVVVDLSGRSYLCAAPEFRDPEVGDFPVSLVTEFFRAVSDHGRFNLHVDLLRSGNDHHGIEAIFKAFAQALDSATLRTACSDSIPSTKGRL